VVRALASVNEIAAYWAWLLLEWVTLKPFLYVINHLGQPSLPSYRDR